ncbi:efflux RND transporter periplasmic adaptor subunit [Alcanivorax sp. JB21]|uniref:efflux RND transporter periplasmic adaptor subunit n=1 Tax=Alcanivorax limicola TaxID=2874102 RepID=UPI001CBF0BAB|nr:efflux RND transporter periplasmic adaptor subunit [Alcanivorax limicola]MBZ2188957.1 efflux RND transporter periplasmic adaptor subunit [Alcanivorax limicola]
MKKINKSTRRTLLLAALAVAIVAGLLLGFREPPALVDTAEAHCDTFRVTVEEEGRTRLADRYEVSAPVSGHLSRVRLEPGDTVQRGDPLFLVQPLYSAPLDARSRAQAEASLGRAEAMLAVTRSHVEAEEARAELARKELERVRPLARAGHLSAEVLDRAETEVRRADAALRSTRFAVDVARHERDNARATLAVSGGADDVAPLTVRAPLDATVLRRPRQSEGAVQAGEPVMVLGDLNSLEVEVDVLSRDAVRIRPGMPVLLTRWGGDGELAGTVRRVEPAGFTRVSALGVEEQRVWVLVDIDLDHALSAGLGDGYRVEAAFLLRHSDDVLQIPVSAVFRDDTGWATYVADNGRARLRRLDIGERSGLRAEVTAGLDAGERVILHPGQDIHEGRRLRTR